jgi:hypothetical protein
LNPRTLPIRRHAHYRFHRVTRCVLGSYGRGGGPASASAATRLGCGHQYDLTAKAKPRDCFLGWPDLSLAESVHLRRIHWKSWGGPRETATARMRTKTYDPWTYVRLGASRRRRASPTDFSTSRDLFYTRVRLRGRAATCIRGALQSSSSATRPKRLAGTTVVSGAVKSGVV